MKVLGILIILIGLVILSIANWESVVIFWHALQDPSYVPPSECSP